MILHSFPSAEATAEAIADRFFLGEIPGKVYRVAVSGGSTPRVLFELLATPRYADRIAWDKIQLYWVDERCVPPTDGESNYGMTQQALLRYIPLQEEQIHRIHGEDEPENEAKRYSWHVCSELPTTQEGYPIFDLILLGIGNDGHTSSIFPHQMELLHEERPYVVAHHPSGQARICLTGPNILVAQQLIFYAVGADKHTVLKRIVEGGAWCEQYPAAYIAHKFHNAELYTDQVL